VGAGQTNHRFYEGTSTSGPLLADYTTAGNQNNYSNWSPGITFRINSGASSTIAVTIYAPEYAVNTNWESRLTINGISVVEVGGSTDPFVDWAASGSGGAVTFDGDTNGDGVKDGLAWLLGASDPDVDARGLLPPAEVNNNGDLVLNFRFLKPQARGNETLALQFSNELGGNDPWENHTVTVPDDSGTVGGVAFIITPVEGTDLNEVEATVPASAAQGTGRLFARLLGNRSIP
jgi:hypothetical protein